MRLMGRSLDDQESEQVEEAPEAVVPVEDVLEEEAFEEETMEAKEPWVVRGETWLQAVKLEKQVSSYSIPNCT